MTEPTNTSSSGSTEPIAGDPLITAEPSEIVDAPVVEPSDPAPGAPLLDPPVGEPAAATEDGGGKVKAAAVVAGAAALANKLRKEGPKVINQLRDRRLVGPCVIITEVDGRFLAIGPYKDEDAARADVFKVGGTPHVAELVSDTSFFAPPEQA